jgi:hypothetical protein
VISAIDPSHSTFPICSTSSWIIVGGQVSPANGTISGLHNQIQNSLLNQFEYDNLLLRNIHCPENHSYLNSNQFIWAVFNLIHVLLIFIFPVILMVFIYTRIYIEARRQKIRMIQRFKPYFLPVPPDQINSIGKSNKIP